MIFEQEHLLEEGELISDAIRKHWIVYVIDFVMHFFGCIIFIVAAVYLASRGSLAIMSSSTSSYGAMILVMFVLIFWTSFFYAWTKHYFDVWYITNKHIIAIDQKQIFKRDEAFMELTRIQDVFFEKEGLIATLLGYGRLKVQTAGTEQEFIIEDVRDVENCAHRILGLRDEMKGKKPELEVMAV